jgi:hypothetical protein
LKTDYSAFNITSKCFKKLIVIAIEIQIIEMIDTPQQTPLQGDFRFLFGNKKAN